MTTKFKANLRYLDSAKIESVTVLSETKCFFTLRIKSWDGTFYETRRSKDSGSDSYFDTWEEARSALEVAAVKAIEHQRSNLERAEKTHQRITAMREPGADS